MAGKALAAKNVQAMMAAGWCGLLSMAKLAQESLNSWIGQVVANDPYVQCCSGELH